jgi:hypothetical protein
MVSLGEVLEGLSGASTIAVILGIPFILLQMRQNARMVEAATRQTELVAFQNRTQVLLTIAERLTDHDFIIRRRVVREIIAQHTQKGWERFADSVDGFEVRAFATQYESTALMAKLGLIDEQTLIETLGMTTVVDWIVLRPALEAFRKVWGPMTFPNFQSLAAASEQYWKSKGATIPSHETLVPPHGSSAT